MSQEFNWTEQVLKQLVKKPNPKVVKKDPQGLDYIPIGVMQNRLDKLFPMMWTEAYKGHEIVANEIIVSIELSVFNPIIGQWITRVGTGAAMIQQAKGAALTDVGAKYKNTLQKDYPNAHARAFRNACKAFGNLFGRSLGRDQNIEAADDFVMTNSNVMISQKSLSQQLDDLRIELDNMQSGHKEKLTLFWKENKADLQEDSVALETFKAYQKYTHGE